MGLKVKWSGVERGVKSFLIVTSKLCVWVFVWITETALVTDLFTGIIHLTFALVL